MKVKKCLQGSLNLFMHVYHCWPILIMLVIFGVNSLLGTNLKVSVEIVAIISFVVAIVCELLRTKNVKETFDNVDFFFKGMGNSMGIVILLIAASVFVSGLKGIGIISVTSKIHGKY